MCRIGRHIAELETVMRDLERHRRRDDETRTKVRPVSDPLWDVAASSGRLKTLGLTEGDK